MKEAAQNQKKARVIFQECCSSLPNYVFLVHTDGSYHDNRTSDFYSPNDDYEATQSLAECSSVFTSELLYKKPFDYTFSMDNPTSKVLGNYCIIYSAYALLGKERNHF